MDKASEDLLKIMYDYNSEPIFEEDPIVEEDNSDLPKYDRHDVANLMQSFKLNRIHVTGIGKEEDLDENVKKIIFTYKKGNREGFEITFIVDDMLKNKELTDLCSKFYENAYHSNLSSIKEKELEIIRSSLEKQKITGFKKIVVRKDTMSNKEKLALVMAGVMATSAAACVVDNAVKHISERKEPLDPPIFIQSDYKNAEEYLASVGIPKSIIKKNWFVAIKTAIEEGKPIPNDIVEEMKKYMPSHDNINDGKNTYENLPVSGYNEYQASQDTYSSVIR